MRMQCQIVPHASADAYGMCVVFRSGTRQSYGWDRSGPLTARAASVALVALSKVGYEAHVERYLASIAVGLPFGYDYDPAERVDEATV